MASIYSSLKVFHFPEQLNALSTRAAAAPVHVRIKPTNVCNHSCWFCAYRNDNLELGDTMKVRDYIPWAKMTEIIDDLAHMNVKAVTLSGGGEPLVYPFISKLVSGLSENKMKLGILSNGSLLKGDLAKQISDQATWIRVSIDGWDDASYSKSRSVKEGEFSKVISNMQSFRELNGPCLLSISYIIDETNAAHLSKTMALFKEIGISQVKLSPVIVSTDRIKQDVYFNSIRGVVDSEIEKIKMSLVDEKFSIANHFHQQNATFQKSYTKCSYAKLLTVIGADQNIYTCQDKAYTDGGLLGNVRERSFKEVWFDQETQNRLAAVNPALQCQHNCVAHPKNLLLEDYLAHDMEHVEFI